MPIWGGPKGYSMVMAAGAAAGHSPADSTTYYFGSPLTTNPSSVEGNAPQALVDNPVGIIRGCRFRLTRFGAETPSTENVAIRIVKNSTVIVSTIASTAQWTAAGVTDWTDFNVQHPVVRGDRLSCRFVAPAWSTNPTICFYQAQ